MLTETQSNNSSLLNLYIQLSIFCTGTSIIVKLRRRAINNTLSMAECKTFCSKIVCSETMSAPLQVGCQVQATSIGIILYVVLQTSKLWMSPDVGLETRCENKNKLGRLPSISFILHKPCPLGTEFKDTVNGKTYIMLFLEFQRGQVEMPIRDANSRLHGATAA